MVAGSENRELGGEKQGGRSESSEGIKNRSVKTEQASGGKGEKKEKSHLDNGA